MIPFHPHRRPDWSRARQLVAQLEYERDAITEEKIHELLGSASDQVTRDICNVALGVLFLPYLYQPEARARCAEIWNARKERK